MNPVADAALRASIVLLIGLGVRAALRRRSPALRHAALAATIVAAPLVGLVGPWLPGVAVPMAWPAAVLGPAAVLAPPAPDAKAIAAGAGPVALESLTVVPPGSDAGPAPAWPTAVLTLWGAGAAAGLGWLLIAAARVRRIAAAGRVVDDARWCRALEQARRDAGLARPIRMVVAPGGLLLATWGWRRPRILIPACALGWSDERVRTVLAHELAHVTRHDWLIQSIAETLRALLWWNPLAWLACRALRHDSELACDDAVLRGGVGPTAYADELLQIARIVAPAGRPASVVMGMARTSTLERRIVAMLNPRLDRRVPTRRTLAALAAAVAVLLLPVALVRAAQSARQVLEGIVYDTTGAVLPGVAVTLDPGPAKWPPSDGSAPTRRPVEVTTDASGRFRIDGVEPGSHVIQVELPGFRALRQPIELRNDRDWNRAVTLQVGDLRETVSVSRKRPASLTPIGDAASGPTPVRVGGNIRAPRKTLNVPPEYPTRMVEAGLEGKVSVEAVVGIDGRVARARAMTVEAHPDLAQAAVDAVRQWRFEPTLLNGGPVEVVMTVTVNFSLD
jgi:TonB family protein